MDVRQYIKNKVCIIGAGTMGVGLAHNFAEHTFEVLLIDNNKNARETAISLLETSYRTQCMLGSPKASFEEIQSRISISGDINQIKNSFFVIENITENLKNKIDLFNNIYDLLDDKTITIVNTSCIPITLINPHVKNPENMLGIHFMNPVPIKPTVEIIVTEVVAEETLKIAECILKLIGKNGIHVQDSPGFVINRVFMVTINESIKTYEEGLCQSVREIDELFSKCLGHKMGPLSTADLIGLDTILYSLQVLYDSFRDNMYKPANLLVKLVQQGKLGKKTGEGLYLYK